MCVNHCVNSVVDFVLFTVDTCVPVGAASSKIEFTFIGWVFIGVIAVLGVLYPTIKK